MEKVTHKEKVRETSEAFIKRLSEGLDDIEEQIYPDYAIEIDIESYDP
tara:strand:+ start:556 stop:699 length:144 start_codon:yes stop_codon:yes gene_type:complete